MSASMTHYVGGEGGEVAGRAVTGHAEATSSSSSSTSQWNLKIFWTFFFNVLTFVLLWLWLIDIVEQVCMCISSFLYSVVEPICYCVNQIIDSINRFKNTGSSFFAPAAIAPVVVWPVSLEYLNIVQEYTTPMSYLGGERQDSDR